MDLARIVYEKQNGLWDQQIGTEIQYLQAKNNYDALQRNLATLNQQRALYNVVAPFGGTADEVLPKLGEVVAPGTPVVRLTSGTGGKILADVSEAYGNSIKAGDKAVVTIPDLGGEEHARHGARGEPVHQRHQPHLHGGAAPAKRQSRQPAPQHGGHGAHPELRPAPTPPSLPVDLVQKDEQNSYVYVVAQEAGKVSGQEAHHQNRQHLQRQSRSDQRPRRQRPGNLGRISKPERRPE
ncbi:MAG: HlyD family efflux transporter periplasmic adaptor subunit [Hymenobacter sp.]